MKISWIKKENYKERWWLLVVTAVRLPRSCRTAVRSRNVDSSLEKPNYKGSRTRQTAMTNGEGIAKRGDNSGNFC